MKKVMRMLACLACLALMVTALGACAGSNDAQDQSTVKIGIIQYISHASLDNCYEGIVQGLIAAGYNEDQIVRQIGSDASADSDCATYAQNMVANGYDIIFAIATPAATAAYAAAKDTDIPVIFCAVSDPVAAGIAESLDAPGGNCTGTSDVLDMEAQVNLIRAMQPDVSSIGVLYTTSEANSITQLESLKAVCEPLGITVDAVGVQNSNDIPAAAVALAGRVDCLNNFTDNNVVNNLSVELDAANNAGIPVYGSEVEQVKKGCLAAVSIDYVALGKVTGEMGASVLEGAAAAEMAVRTISDATPVINSTVASALGLTIPDEYADGEMVETVIVD